MSITTTAKEEFTMEEHADMARLIFKRFGNDLHAATRAWRRLMENCTTEEQFQDLLNTHKPIMPTPDAEGVWVVVSEGDYSEQHGGRTILGMAKDEKEAQDAADYLQDCAKARPCEHCGHVYNYLVEKLRPIKECM